MKKILGAVALALVCSFLAVLLIGALGPYRTLSSIKQGIIDRDADQLAEYIDFDALRQNLKDQMRAYLLDGMRSQHLDHPAVAGLAASLGGIVLDGLVNNLATPSGLASLMSGERPVGDKVGREATREEKEQAIKARFKDARYAFDSLSRFSLWLPAEGQEEARIVLHRDWLTWKLTNIVIPLDGLPGAKP